MVKGLIISFSGLDGAGKSTQIELLLERLRREGQNPVYLWSRGGYTPLFEVFKSLLRRLSGRAMPPSGHNPMRTHAFGRGWVRLTWLILAILDLVWVYGVEVRWWRWRGRPVICDRYLWDTLIDFRLNFPQEKIEGNRLWQFLVRVTPRPDAAFLLLVPVEEAVWRLEAKGLPNSETPQVLAERLAQYKDLAERGYWRVLDGRRTVDSLAHEIWEALPDPKGLSRRLAGHL